MSSKKNPHQVVKKAAKPKKTEVQASVAPAVVAATVEPVAQPVAENKSLRNMERFLEATGKTQQDYFGRFTTFRENVSDYWT